MFFGAGELWDFPATFDYSTRGYIMVCIYIYTYNTHTHMDVGQNGRPRGPQMLV